MKLKIFGENLQISFIGEKKIQKAIYEIKKNTTKWCLYTDIKN